jgi:hypothetical protein
MRLRARKLSHVRSDKTNGLGERNVTESAAAIWCLEMRRSDAMAVETVLGNRKPNLHAVRAWPHMTRPAAEERIRIYPLHCPRVCAMSKAQIGSGWIGRRFPGDCLFDDRVVAGTACCGGGPERLGLVFDRGMAADAAGKKLAVLPVIETIPHLRLARMNQAC